VAGNRQQELWIDWITSGIFSGHTTIVNPAAVVVKILWVVIIHDEVQVHFAIWTKHGVVPLTPFVEVPH